MFNKEYIKKHAKELDETRFMVIPIEITLLEHLIFEEIGYSNLRKNQWEQFGNRIEAYIEKGETEDDTIKRVRKEFVKNSGLKIYKDI